MNFSFNGTEIELYQQPEQYIPTTNDVIRDFCSQLEHSILICVLLIYLYFMMKLLTPQFKILNEKYGFSVLKPHFDMVADFVLGVNENLALMGTALLIILFWLQDPPTFFKVWIISMISLVVLIRISEIIEWRRQKKK